VFKALNIWLPAYLRQKKVPLPQDKTIHLIIAICDHFEPLHNADKSKALERLNFWKKNFPLITERFFDSDGIPPRHTFFYPIEQIDSNLLNELKYICDKTGGEVEIHLHHKSDIAETLKEKLLNGISELQKFGFLCSDENKATRYGFIHGDWALTNSHPKKLFCGVDNEISVLRQTGCYADFTMPSAPDPTQSKIINSIYYVRETGRPRSFDVGEIVKVNPQRKNDTVFSRPAIDELLLVQGPLGLNWRSRKFGILPRIENGNLTRLNPPTIERLKLWIKIHIHIQGKPEWIFIKLHTHGGIESNFKMLLGDPMIQFHTELKKLCDINPHFKFHYVTAREMVNIIHSAEVGLSGEPHLFRNSRYKR